MTPKCQKITMWTLLGTGTVLVLLGAFMPLIFNGILHGQIKDQVVMAPENYAQWGEVPGETGVNIVRNFSFFELQNKIEFFYGGAKPVFKQLDSYSYFEKTVFANQTYLDNDNQVQYNLWRWYDTNGWPREAQNSTFVNLLNLGALGVWYQGKTANISLLGLQGFGLLTLNVTEVIINQVMGFGMQWQFIKSDEEAVHILSGIGFTPEQAIALYNDPVYGWKTNLTLFTWGVFGQQSEPWTGAGAILKDYFKLSYRQLADLYTIIKSWTDGIYATGILNGYCLTFYPNETCTPKLLSAMQMTQQTITSYAPPLSGVPPFESIARYNASLFTYPEITYWYNNLLTEEERGQFVNVTNNFTATWYQEVFNFTKYVYPTNTSVVNQTWNLLNIYNMDMIMTYGLNYNQSCTTQCNDTYLELIANKTLLNQYEFSKQNATLYAKKFWYWMSYVVREVVLARKIGGTPAEAAFGLFSTQALYDAWTRNEWALYDHIEARLVQRYILDAHPNATCMSYLNDTLYGVTNDTLTSVCTIPELSQFPGNVTQVSYVLQMCEYQSGPLFQAFTKVFPPQSLQFQTLCSPTGGSVYQDRDVAARYLAQVYSCNTTFGPYCSHHEIAVMQWADGRVTQQVPVETGLVRVPTTYDWGLAPHPWEFSWFASQKRAYTAKVATQWRPDYMTADQLLTYNGLFSQTLVQQVVLQAVNQTNFMAAAQLLAVPEFSISTFIVYMRYMLLEYGFDGLTQERTVHSYLFGWQDPIIKMMAEQDPQTGGNPSYPTCVLLNDPNITLYAGQAENWTTCANFTADQFVNVMYTGKDDIQQVRQFQSVYGSPNIMMNYSWYNGTDVIRTIATPWNGIVPLSGTDGVINQPFEKTNGETQLPTFIYTSYCGPTMVTNDTDEAREEFYGLETQIYTPVETFWQSKLQYPQNALYFQDKYDGYLNLTNIQRAPVFISQTHFYQANDLNDSVTFIDPRGEIIEASVEDNNFQKVEPTSGITISAKQNAQANLLFEHDCLFANLTTTRMLPVFNMYRGATWKEDQINEFFGQLMTANKAYWFLIFVPIGIGLALAAGGGYMLYRFKKHQREHEHEEESEVLKVTLVDQSQKDQSRSQYESAKSENIENYA